MPIYVLEGNKEQTRRKDNLVAQDHYSLPIGDVGAHHSLTAKIAVEAFELFVQKILVKATQRHGRPDVLWGMPILRGGLSLVDYDNIDIFNRILVGKGMPALKMSAVSVAVDHIGGGQRYDSVSIQWSTFGSKPAIQNNPSITVLLEREAVIVFDWGIATGRSVRTVFDWLETLGFRDRNLYCLALIGVPCEIKSMFPNEHIMLAAEAAFRPGTIYVDHICNTQLGQTKDWGHSHYPTDTWEGIENLLTRLKRVVAVGQSDIDTLVRVYSSRPSLAI
jgi:uracil phosphoribosyltransferase